MKPTYLIIAILLCVLAYVYFTKDSGTSQLLKEKDRAEQILIDSIHSIARRDLKLFSEMATKLDKMEGEKNYWKNKAQKCDW